MKYKNIKSFIIWRFLFFSIAFYILTTIIDVMFEYIFNLFTIRYGLGDVIEAQFSNLSLKAQVLFISLFVFYFAILFFLYFFGIKLFAKGVQKKIQMPVYQLSQGLEKVTNGCYSVRMDFTAEYEFCQMKDAFNTMTERLEKAEKEKEKYQQEKAILFANIAHDLKTPMTTITGYAKALERELVEEKKQKEYFTAISTKAQQINQLIEKLSSYTKLENTEYQFQFAFANVSEILRLCCADYFSQFEEKNFIFETNIPTEEIYSIVDRVELSRAIYNLLSNAIVHNTEGTTVEVSLKIINQQIEIAVKDNGERIPKEMSEHLFDPFFCGDVSRVSKNGSGLGLSIVKKIVQRHGGDVYLREEKTPYTKAFIIHIPIAEQR